MRITILLIMVVSSFIVGSEPAASISVSRAKKEDCLLGSTCLYHQAHELQLERARLSLGITRDEMIKLTDVRENDIKTVRVDDSLLSCTAELHNGCTMISECDVAQSRFKCILLKDGCYIPLAPYCSGRSYFNMLMDKYVAKTGIRLSADQ